MASSLMKINGFRAEYLDTFVGFDARLCISRDNVPSLCLGPALFPLQPLDDSMINTQVSMRRAQRGQGMTEYIIIVALVAVAAIAVYSYFGKSVRSQTSGIANEVAGVSASTDITNAQTAAATARTEAAKNKSLDSYNSK